MERQTSEKERVRESVVCSSFPGPNPKCLRIPPAWRQPTLPLAYLRFAFILVAFISSGLLPCPWLPGFNVAFIQ